MIEKGKLRIQAEQEVRLKAERERMLSKMLGENHLLEL